MQPELWVIAGPNGAGKTTLVRALRSTWPFPTVYLNPDERARDVFGDWNNVDHQLAAAREIAAEREQLLAARQSFAFETVFSAPDKLDFTARAKAAGFFIRFCFIALTGPELHAARVALRVMQGGHEVPITKIVERYERAITQAARAVPIVDRAYFVDNSQVGIEGLQPLFRTQDGAVVKRYVADLPAWAQAVFDVLPADDAARVPSRSTLRFG